MDYVHGRSVKLTVRRFGDRLGVWYSWYDHSTASLKAMLEQVGIDPDEVDKARAADEAETARVKAAALDYIKERGGVILEDRKLKPVAIKIEDLPADVESGLCQLVYGDNPVVTATYRDDGITEYRLKAA